MHAGRSRLLTGPQAAAAGSGRRRAGSGRRRAGLADGAGLAHQPAGRCCCTGSVGRDDHRPTHVPTRTGAAVRAESCDHGRVSALLQQLPVLLGVLLGTVGTIVATSLADRARWRRSQSVRWDDSRLQAYVSYAETLKEVHAVAIRIHREKSGRTAATAEEASLARLLDAELRRTTAWEKVLLLGDPATVVAAREWHYAVGQVAQFARSAADDGAQWTELVHDANVTRDRFYEAARAGLGVGGGAVPQSDWLARGPRDAGPPDREPR